MFEKYKKIKYPDFQAMTDKLPVHADWLAILDLGQRSQGCPLQGRSQLFVNGGPKPKILDLFADFAQQSRANEVSPNWLGSRAHLMALEALGFFITK